MFRLQLCLSLSLSLTLALISSQASAVPIDYELQQGSEPQFRFSFIHSAVNSCCGAPPEYFNSGTKLFRLSGTLSADWDAGTETATVLVDQTLTAEVLDASVGGAVGELWSFIIEAGSSLERDPNGRASGLLDYEIKDTGGVSKATGTFHVFAETVFPTSVNRVSATRFNTWANNWDNSSESPPVGGVFASLGIDMVSMPEPSGALLLASAALAAGLRRRSRSG